MLGLGQPPVTAAQLQQAQGGPLRYRVMAFVTGVVLRGRVELIVKYGLRHRALDPLLWVGHGWLFVIYVVITALLGFKLRWPLARYGLVMLAGTIPTMSFVAEHFVTRGRARPAALSPSTRD